MQTKNKEQLHHAVMDLKDLSGYFKVILEKTAFMVDDVREFQSEILGKNYPDSPCRPTQAQKDYIATCLQEELDEFKSATNIVDEADAICDLVYFALGAAYQHGIDFTRVWKEVQRANMSKISGVTHRGVPGDAKKPEGWKAPDHSWLLEKEHLA